MHGATRRPTSTSSIIRFCAGPASSSVALPTHLAAMTSQGKPFAVTEFGCAPFTTAADRGRDGRTRRRSRTRSGIAPSTGSVGDSYDNALAENLWSTIKTELLYWAGAEFASRAEAESALLRYIDGWYNPRRIQEGLGGLSPDEYEEVWHRHGDPAMIHPEPEPSR